MADVNYDGDIKHPFDPSKINISTKQTTIDNMIKRMRHGEITLNPDFQRSDEVWDDVARSRLIESLLVRIPIPAFYIDGTNDENWLIIDGLQRLTTLKKYVIEESFSLINLEYLTDLNDSKFHELDRKFQRRIEETEVTILTIHEGTPEDVKYNIFKRINTGGVSLEPQEIRQALFRGPGVKLLSTIAQDSRMSFFKENTDNKRQLRNEIVLRALSTHLLGEKEAAQLNIDSSLNETLKKLNDLDNNTRDEISNRYFFALKAAQDLFGEFAFRKPNTEGRRNPVSLPLYEAWMSNLMPLNKNDLDKLLKNKDTINKNFTNLIEDKRFIYAISGRKEEGIIYRNTKIKEILGAVLND